MMWKVICSWLFIGFLFPYTAGAEVRGTWGGDASAYAADNDIGFSYSVNYHLWLNRCVSVSVGALFTHFYADAGGEWKGASGVSYAFPERLKSRALNAQAGLRLYTPPLWHTGLYGGGNAFFDLIPFNVVSLNRVTHQTPVSDVTEDVGRFRFNRFSPGAFLELGLYHDFRPRKNPERACRLSIGYGYGYYDPFSAYRRAVADGVRIGDKMASDDRHYHRLTLRLTGLF